MVRFDLPRLACHGLRDDQPTRRVREDDEAEHSGCCFVELHEDVSKSVILRGNLVDYWYGIYSSDDKKITKNLALFCFVVALFYLRSKGSCVDEEVDEAEQRCHRSTCTGAPCSKQTSHMSEVPLHPLLFRPPI